MNSTNDNESGLSPDKKKLTSPMTMYRRRFQQRNKIIEDRIQSSRFQQNHHNQTYFPPNRYKEYPLPTLTSSYDYVALSNLTKLLHTIENQEKLNENDTATETSLSTVNSSKQRVQQHLQQTAIRWSKPIRLSVSQTPSMKNNSLAGSIQYSVESTQSDRNLPPINNGLNSRNDYANDDDDKRSKTKQSDASTIGFIPIISRQRKTDKQHITIQKPLILQTNSMREQIYGGRYFSNNMKINLFQQQQRQQQQRLIRQT